LVLKLLVALEIGHSSKTASTTAALSAVPARKYRPAVSNEA
jgi:hypothetical protein